MLSIFSSQGYRHAWTKRYTEILCLSPGIHEQHFNMRGPYLKNIFNHRQYKFMSNLPVMIRSTNHKYSVRYHACINFSSLCCQSLTLHSGISLSPTSSIFVKYLKTYALIYNLQYTAVSKQAYSYVCTHMLNSVWNYHILTHVRPNH